MLISFTRTIFLYTVLILSIRLMGKRQIGQMEASEFVVTMLVANLAAIPMQSSDAPLLSGLVPILSVLGMELVLSFLILKSMALRTLLCGKPVILIDNGKILRSSLRRTRITMDELMGHLRQKDVLCVSDVQFAILETDGNLSVFPYPAQRPATAKEAGLHPEVQHLPICLVEDGWVSRENLRKAGKDRLWLQNVLHQHGTCLRDTLLLTVDESDQITWLGKGAGE